MLALCNLIFAADIALILFPSLSLSTCTLLVYMVGVIASIYTGSPPPYINEPGLEQIRDSIPYCFSLLCSESESWNGEQRDPVTLLYSRPIDCYTGTTQAVSAVVTADALYWCVCKPLCQRLLYSHL